MTQADEQPFWTRLDRLVQESTVVVDRPRGACHPRFPELVYPMDCGYLAETRTTDDGGVDVWLGSLAEWRVTSALITSVTPSTMRRSIIPTPPRDGTGAAGGPTGH